MEILLRLIVYLQSILRVIIKAFHPYVYSPKTGRIPLAKDELLNCSATTLAKKIRSREVTSEQVVKAYIDRIRQVNPLLNAVVEDRFEAALNDAKISDEKLRNKTVNPDELEKEKPLFGVPITVKESCSLKGHSLAVGSVVRRGIKAIEDGHMVETLKNAGAIPLCITNTPELCTSFDSSNYITGRTVNPYDLSKCAGGSSGGEGALLGAGASVIGVGSDIAGSIRIPALWNGVFGHKPTPGILSIRGHYPMSDNSLFMKYLVVGPLTRFAEDLRLSMKVLGQKSEKDLRLDEPLDAKKIKVFHFEEATTSFLGVALDPELRNSITNAANHLSSRGCKIEKTKFGLMEDICELAVAMFFGIQEMPKLLMDPDNPKVEKSTLPELAKAIFGLSQYTKSAIYVKFMQETNCLIPQSNIKKYKEETEVLRKKILNMLGEDGVLLYPTYPYTAQAPFAVPLTNTGIVYCMLWNIFGFPSTNVPAGLSSKGLPLGFQVIAAPFQDRLCLTIAQELEDAFGGWTPPPSSTI